MFTKNGRSRLSQQCIPFMLGSVIFCTALAFPASVWAQSASEDDILVDKARFTLGNFSQTVICNGFENILRMQGVF